MSEGVLDDVRSSNPVERLLEDSWAARKRGLNQRELLVEDSAAAIFLCLAVPPAISALSSRLIEFPIGAGYVVPSYLVLVPMLLLLPPGLAPMLTATGLVLGSLGQALAGGAGSVRGLFSIPAARPP